MNSNPKKSFNKRAVVSIALFAMFILLPLSGKMVLAKQNTPESMYIWGSIHALLGFLFAIFGIFHIVYNWQTLKHYLQRR